MSGVDFEMWVHDVVESDSRVGGCELDAELGERLERHKVTRVDLEVRVSDWVDIQCGIRGCQADRKLRLCWNESIEVTRVDLEIRVRSRICTDRQSIIMPNKLRTVHLE